MVGKVNRLTKSIKRLSETFRTESGAVLAGLRPLLERTEDGSLQQREHRLCLGLGLGSVQDNKSTGPQLALFMAIVTELNPTDILLWDPVMGALDVAVASALGLTIPEEESRGDLEIVPSVVYAPHAPHALAGRVLKRIARDQADGTCSSHILIYIGNPLCEVFPSLHPAVIKPVMSMKIPFEERPEAFSDTYIHVLDSSIVAHLFHEGNLVKEISHFCDAEIID